MGALDDLRKLLQDIVAPDLKAINARLEALEKAMRVGFDHAEKLSTERFAAVEQRSSERFAAAEQRAVERSAAMQQRFSAVDQHLAAAELLAAERFSAGEQRFKYNEQIASLRHESLLAEIRQVALASAANHEEILKAMDMDRRVERLEQNFGPAQPRPEAEQAQSHPLPQSA